jgi:hypothetical protein
MHLTDSALRHQLFLDVLDGTKALVSVSGRFPFPPGAEVSEVTQRTYNFLGSQLSGQRA